VGKNWSEEQARKKACSFLQKRTKKLLFMMLRLAPEHCANFRSFSFFSKKKCFLPSVDSSMLSAPREKPGQRPIEIRLIQQEGIMPAVGFDFHKTDVGRGAIERAGDAA
jgi:hypothetical protein